MINLLTSLLWLIIFSLLLIGWCWFVIYSICYLITLIGRLISLTRNLLKGRKLPKIREFFALINISSYPNGEEKSTSITEIVPQQKLSVTTMIQDINRRPLGFLEETEDIIVAKNTNGVPLALYDKKFDYTRDLNGNILARGNLLITFIYKIEHKDTS